MPWRPTILTLAVAIFGSLASHAAERSGLALLGDFNCTVCHAATEQLAAWLSPKIAPRLEGLGSRASAEWVRSYLASPHTVQPGATMPDVLHGLPAAERDSAIEALTHHLLSRATPKFRRTLPDRAAVARGETLFHGIGCVACHAPQNTKTNLASSVPMPRMAEKWAFDGLRRFLLDPHALRPSGRMPALALTDGEAADLSHYLLRETRVSVTLEVAQYRGRLRSLEEIDTAELARTGPADSFSVEKLDRGSALRFHGWLRVEQAGDYTFFHTAAGASRLALDGQWLTGEDSWQRDKVDAKRTVRLEAGWREITVDFAPRGSKPSSLKLEWEGPGVARESVPASRLRSGREAVPEPVEFRADPAKAGPGRALFTQLNCAVCHEQKAPAKPAPALTKLDSARGCLAEKPEAAVPDFHLAPTQMALMRDALGELKRADLAAPSPKQRVAHTMATFRCTACHARDGAGGVPPERDAYFTSNGEDLGDEGRVPPRLDGVGDKLRPGWLRKVLTAGADARPYLNTRMPRFGVDEVARLADLFVTLDRHAEPLPPAADAPEAQRDAGRKLIGTDGLSCIACHRFNRQPAHALQILDLAPTPERLNEDWFRRFLRDPNRFNVGTRMPSLWPDGVSPLPAVLGGSTERQYAALWTYLSDGARAKSPEGLSRQNMELVVGGEAVVYRGKLWEAGFRAVAVGYPGQVNAAFDAEEMRLALVWRGRFLNAGAHWGVQGMGQIHPLGDDVVIFPHGSAFAVLADDKAPWPTNAPKELGAKFRGHQVDVRSCLACRHSAR